MSGRVKMLQDLLATENPIELPRGGFQGISKATQGARQKYERCCDQKQFWDLVMHFRVAIFGSARFDKNSGEFKFVANLAKALVEARRIDIVTGGGPGIMEAANRGLNCARGAAKKNGEKCKARNVGVMVDLPFENEGNPHLHINTKHRRFATRLHAFISQIKAAYIAPGGIGTLLELAYLMQLKQVGHLEKTFPIIAHPCWEKPLVAFCESFYDDRLEAGLIPTISEKDLKLVKFSADIKEPVGAIVKEYDFWRKYIHSRVKFVANLG